METTHISHVILYSKNFYRHTGDIIKDMQRFLQLDGHPFWTIKTPAKLVNTMRADFLKWANSLPDDFHCEAKERIIRDVDEGVRWAKGEEALIYHWLITYSCYIPLVGSITGYPIYDKWHLPQFNVKEHLFNENMSYDEMMKVAKDFLDETQESRYDRFMNNLLEKYDFERVANIFNLLGDAVTANELEDEMWDGYTEFMDEHSHEDGTMDSGYFDKFTKHFDLHFSTKNFNVNIDAEALFNTKTYTVNEAFSDSAIDKVFEVAASDTEFIMSIIESGNAINKIIDEDGYWGDKINEDRLTFDSMHNSIVSAASSFKEEDSKEYLNEHKSSWHACGYKKYIVTLIDEKTFTLQIIFEHLFGCSSMESELWTGNSYTDKSY